MALSLPETVRFDFTTPSSTGTFPPIIEACSKMNFTFKTIDNIEESPFSPYYIQFYVQQNGTPPYSFLGGSFSSTEKGELNLPFNNSQVGTQFVTCMYTSNGQTGGCQNLYTVIESSNNCIVDPLPTVGNPLNVFMQTPSSAGALTDLGRYSSWPTGCTDIHFKVDGGAPPYLMTIANAYVPPRNYTFETNSFEWKVDLARGYPFFLSIFDSAGLSYTAGPLHVGGGGSTSCLATSGGSRNSGAFAGAALGGIVFGALVALASLWGMRTWRKKHPKPLFSPVEENFAPTPFVDRASSLREPGGPNAPRGRTEVGGGSRSPPTSPRGTEGDSRGRNVFVVHHDGGGAPVSVFTDADSQVFELPPSYLNAGPSAATPSSNASGSTRRRPPPLDRSISDLPKHAGDLLPLPSLEWEAYRNSLLSPSSVATPTTSRPPRTSDDVSSSSPTTTKTELPPLPLEATSTLSSYVGATPTSSDQALLSDSSTGAGGVGGSRRPAGVHRDWSDTSEKD